MLRSLSVENFRSFDKEAKIELRPITILLGRNSAGKSSLTRLFPVLQQSMERGTSAPILWNSTSIDFGKIGDVIGRRHPERAMKISFGFSDEILENVNDRRPSVRSSVHRDFSFSGSFTAHLGSDKAGKTEYRSFDLVVDQDRVSVSLKGGIATGVELNGRRVVNPGYWSRIITGSKRLFPYVFFENDSDRDRMGELPATSEAMFSILSKFVHLADQKTDIRLHSRSRNVLGGISYGGLLPFVPRRSLRNVLASIPEVIPQSLDDNEGLDELADLLLVTYFSQIVEHVGGNMAAAFSRSTYLGPIRASGNRFYREQELSVDKIDDKGENLATYIGSLSKTELSSFNEMMVNAFGVEVRPHPDGGHISIEIGRPSDEHFDNLADVGFGFSQLLPLVAQLHSESRRQEPWRPKNTSSMQITAVEQPELHLHPAYQASLADLFVSSISAAQKRGNLPIIILETHSEAMLGRLGELVSDGKISAKDVAVHFVEKNESDGSSTVRMGSFDAEGFVMNWPVGFFSSRR